jgi:SpoVK/Ycf46/Vps4 family AAA+-type ATPase
MCQSFLARSHASMVVFEEMEDVFPAEGTMMGSKRERFVGNKAEINSMLEQNPVPTLWISNDVGYMDSAYLRRFDYALELLPPPRSVRKNIIRRHFADLPVPESYLDNLAANEELTPAQVERVAKVARHAGITQQHELGRAVERMIENSMSLMGQTRVSQKLGDAVQFGIEFLNVGTPIDALIEGLKQATTCRMCFYGPPGTGKTSLGRHLAEALDRPLMVKRASDLLGRFVGQTEQNLARMFRTARDDGAVLLLDEADGFLRDRQTAQQSWEVTQVNELLTQMEDFDGVFICATNLMDRLDPAALRRFDFKVRFDCLNNEQRWRLFVRYLDELGYSCLAGEETTLIRSLEKLNNLTPGDFAVASRQFRILGLEALPSLLLATLAEECKAKPESGGRIGFV